MIDDPFAAGVSALKTRGFYPINHCVAVRDAVLEEHPEVATQVFDAFAESKKLYVDDLKAGRISEPSPADKVHLAAMEFMDDPLPYGIELNRHTLEGLIGHAVTQKIIPQPLALEDLFAEPVANSVA
jgi:4,5-dihydroxyphthalate decarboxylase